LETLLQHVEKGDVLVTQSIQDKHIASKRDNKKYQSNIVFTKPKGAGKWKSKGTKDAKMVFPLHNPSAISSLPPKQCIAKAKQRSPPGSAAHLHWTKLKFCQYCNYGVTGKRACMCVCFFLYSQACSFGQTPNKNKQEMCDETKHWCGIRVLPKVQCFHQYMHGTYLW
jgi:hypothetical protein